MFNTNNVVLIGSDETVLPHARREIANYGLEIGFEFPNVQAAIKKFWLNEKEHCLFVVLLSTDDAVSEIKQLNGAYAGNPILALIDIGNSPSLLLRIIRAGASQVVPLPLQADDFHEALDSIGLQQGVLPGTGKIVAVTGAAGGCGASVIALNLACEIGFVKKHNVVLMELSLRHGVMADYLNLQPKYTTIDLLKDMAHVDAYVVQQAVTKVTDELSVFPAAFDNIERKDVSPDNVLQMIEIARNLGAMVVLDVPCTYDDLYFRTLEAADQTILVVEQKVSAIRGASLIAESLSEQLPIVVVNRYNPHMEGFAEARLGELIWNRSMLTIPFDPSLAKAVENACLLRLENPQAKALVGIDALVNLLIPDHLGKDDGRSKHTLMDRISHIFS